MKSENHDLCKTAATTIRSDQIRLLWNIGGETMVPSIFKDLSVMTDVTVKMRGKTQKEKEDREWRGGPFERQF